MKKKTDNRKFWNRYAKLYDFEIDRFNRSGYAEMYKLIAASLNKEMRVLEIATGTGLIAINIAGAAAFVEATDFSPGMIAAAKKKPAPENVCFSVADATALPFGTDSFDAVIISNALHIMPDPRLVLENIKRVLKPDGILIAPTFSHGHQDSSKKTLNRFVLKLIGFETCSRWEPEEYVSFINENGFSVSRWKVIKAAFPLVYLEAGRPVEPAVTA